MTSSMNKVHNTRKSSRKHQNKNFYQDYESFKKIIESTLPILFPEVERETLGKHMGYIYHLMTHKGQQYTVRYLKATFESLEAFILRTPKTLEHDEVSIGKDLDGWPLWLGTRLKSMCSNNHTPSIRYAFTLVSTRRLIVVPTKTNLSSITSPPTWETEVDLTPLLDTTEWYEEENLRDGLRNPTLGQEAVNPDSITTYRVPKLQISLKSSPNGVSFFSFPWDRAAVLLHSLEGQLEAFASTYFKGDVESWLQDRLDPYEELQEAERPLHVGKISLTFEGGKLKPRVFAIVDSVTQSLLGDFHQDLMRILRKIPEDCTFDQDKVKSVAKRIHLENKPFYGFADLSNATDRLPIYLYRQVGDWLSPNLGTSWVGLFDRDFKVGKSVTDHWTPGERPPTHVKYQAGQPMGALSSWPFMALVHHVLVWHSFGSRKRARNKYLILGDDVVIFDKEAYEKYCALLDTLCVSYTHNVSIVGFEFAKRTFAHGKEITGAYTSALWSSRRNPELFCIAWRNLASRGYITGPGLPESFRSLLKVSRTRFFRLSRLVEVPYGTSISTRDLAQWCVGLQGRSWCLPSRMGSDDSFVEHVKAFRQIAALQIKQRFQSDLDEAKMAVQSNKETYLDALETSSGLSDQYKHALREAYNEVIEEQTVRIRYLERDLKRLYLSPTDARLLRPNLPDVPRRIDFSSRDMHKRKIVVRAEHQMAIIDVLTG
jgi:hypothetical protein